MRQPTIERQRPDWSGIVTFGSPYHESLPAQIARLGVKRIFVVGSRSLFHTSPELQHLRDLLGDTLLGVKEGVGPQRLVRSKSI
jgi:hypothetical protein